MPFYEGILIKKYEIHNDHALNKFPMYFASISAPWDSIFFIISESLDWFLKWRKDFSQWEISLGKSSLKTCLDESVWIQIILSQLNRLIWKYIWPCFKYKYELTISRLMSLRSCAALFSSQWASSGAESSLSPSVSTCRKRFRALSTNSTPKTACNKNASFIFTKDRNKTRKKLATVM